MRYLVPASIPSPSSNAIHIGGLQLRAYGLMIALGVIAAVWLAGKRWVEAGGAPDDLPHIALWAVPAGVIGARIYHVITDWQTFFPDHPWRAFYIWEGGLGIWGGIALGVAVGLWRARLRGLALGPLLDAAAPALALAQAIGRWGNWFNQELFGKPTSLPWGLRIDVQNRPPGYTQFTTFQPTFLYESLWCLLLVGALILIGKRWGGRLAPGSLFWIYVSGYTFERFFIERMRIDYASKLWGLRVNEWTSVGVFTLGLVMLLIINRRHGAVAPEPVAHEDPAAPEDPADPADPVLSLPD